MPSSLPSMALLPHCCNWNMASSQLDILEQDLSGWQLNASVLAGEVPSGAGGSLTGAGAGLAAGVSAKPFADGASLRPESARIFSGGSP